MPEPHTPRWHRAHAQLAIGQTTPRRIAHKLGLSLEEALAWLYPKPQTSRARLLRRNEVTR